MFEKIILFEIILLILFIKFLTILCLKYYFIKKYSMSINLIVDCKENKTFTDLLQTYVKFDIVSLHIGDIAFSHNGENILYIERKTINDLAASLNDGRYHEQKARLKGNRVIYLIEEKYSSLNKTYHKTFDIEKYKGCIINTMVRDNIHVHQTENMAESCQFIADIAKRLPKYINEIVNKKEEKDEIVYTNSLKIKKKDNITPQVCFINQLAQIPGVSITMAQILAEKYKNMRNLIEEYDKLIDKEKDREKMLANIMMDTRKIGPVVSKRIYEYTFL